MKMTMLPEAKLVRSFGDWANDMNTVVDSLFGAVSDRNSGASGFAPRMDIRESQQRYDLSLDLPGVKSTEVNLELDGDYLVIHGSKKTFTETEGDRYHRVERLSGDFRRVVRLPQDVDRDQISADYGDGVLSVKLPKVQAPTARRIEIRSASEAAAGAEASSGE